MKGARVKGRSGAVKAPPLAPSSGDLGDLPPSAALARARERVRGRGGRAATPRSKPWMPAPACLPAGSDATAAVASPPAEPGSCHDADGAPALYTAALPYGARRGFKGVVAAASGRQR